MKFSNGCWLQKEGVQLFAPAEAYFITKTDTEVTILAPTGRVYNNACTLGGINLTVKISSPRKDVLRVQTYHHLGAVVKEPAFELTMQECPLNVMEDNEKIVVDINMDNLLGKKLLDTDASLLLPIVEDRHLVCDRRRHSQITFNLDKLINAFNSIS